MQHTYFAGANSAQGFYSLYSHFASKPGDTLHIIKGGPGTGKSGFMRRIGERAQALGLGVEYVICSGDPDSLDGVYIPAMKTAFADGTAPHIAEPELFGVTGDYINIGSFCSMPFSRSENEHIRRTTLRYKALYGRAYSFLAAACEAEQACTPNLMTESAAAGLFGRIDDILASVPPADCESMNADARFISAVSCKGFMVLEDELKPYEQYSLESSTGFVPAVLRHAAEECQRRAIAYIDCRRPLMPDDSEAIIIPAAGLCFVDARIASDPKQRINCDTAVAIGALKAAAPDYKKGIELSKQLTEMAIDKLREAKTLHDELESVYIANMDFPALTQYTEDYCDKLFVNYIR